jgi:hypothetical protein
VCGYIYQAPAAEGVTYIHWRCTIAVFIATCALIYSCAKNIIAERERGRERQQQTIDWARNKEEKNP